MGKLEELGEFGPSCLCSLDDLVIQVNRGDDTMDSVAWVERRVKTFAKERNQRVAHLIFLESGVRPPSAEMRGRLSQAMENLSASLTAQVVVFDGVGFFASMVIAVATSLTTSTDIPYKIARTAKQGSQYIRTYLRSAYTPDDIEQFVHEARAFASGKAQTG